MTSGRRVEILIFAAALFAFAFFNQGGGWNQNARFAEVRAIVEEGRFAIDSFLIYQRAGGDVLSRIPIQNGMIERTGRREILCWTDARGNVLPINGEPLVAGSVALPLDRVAASGDVSWARGHFHPNKPPGVSLLSVPGYLLLHSLQRWLGIAPDNWRALNTNAWLTSVLSVGLFSAFGCVIFFRVAKMLALWSPAASESTAGAAATAALPALLATLSFAFGTLYFPFATVLFDHNLTAVFLLTAFYFLLRAKRAPEAGGARRTGAFALAGLCAGLAAITNYVAAVAVAILGIYLVVSFWREGSARLTAMLGAYAVGVLGPLLLICFYNAVCYGSPFVLSNDFQNPLFEEEGGITFLGMFSVPNPFVAFALLVSPFRGILLGAPVLLLAGWGFLKLRGTQRAEFWLIAAMCALFFFINVTFSGWHAGRASGSRYLIPAITFLSLPLVFAFANYFKTTCVLALASVGINGLHTAVDAQSPIGVCSIAMVEDRPQWLCSPLADYALPLFATTPPRAWPTLEQLLAEHLRRLAPEAGPSGANAGARPEVTKELHLQLHERIARGEPEPFPLAAFEGPVSVNTTGAFEGDYFAMSPARSAPARWASFNLGELLFPMSRLSLLPLALVLAALLVPALRAAARHSGDRAGVASGTGVSRLDDRQKHALERA